MLFGKRNQVVKRILIVEDEPLTAFDNENMLGDAGYEVVATVDDLDEALEILEREQIDLILSDVRLRKDQTGIDLARAAKAKGVPTLFATGHSYPGASEVAVGCVMKPYTERQLCKAIEMLDSDDVHLILSDVRLASQQTGIDLARAASEHKVPTLFATGHPYPEADKVAIGLLMKPYSDRQLKAALEAVDLHLQGKPVKPPKGLTLFTRE